MPPVNNAPLDINEFKEIVRRESVRLRKIADPAKHEDEYTMALAVAAAVKKIFYEKSATKFSGEPALEKKIVTQFVSRMRVDAMEKFNATTVFSSVEFAANEEALKKQEYLMTLVVYLDKQFLPDFLRMMQYPYIDSEDDQEVKDGCGTLLNLIGGQYKREMVILKHKDLAMSAFGSYINTAADGLEIPKGAVDKYEISFEIDGVKRLVVEVVPSAKIHD